MAFRLKSLEPKEGDIQNAIIQMLTWEQAKGRVIIFARHNSGGLFDKQGRWVWFMTYWLKPGEKINKGFPDLSGLLSDGRAFFLEVKKSKSAKTTNHQSDFIKRARLHGAAAGVVCSVDEAREVIFGLEIG